jgi:hypothetical protein
MYRTVHVCSPFVVWACQRFHHRNSTLRWRSTPQLPVSSTIYSCQNERPRCRGNTEFLPVGGRKSDDTASQPPITLSISHLHDSSRCTAYHGVRSAGACTSEPSQDVERLPMPCDKLWSTRTAAYKSNLILQRLAVAPPSVSSTALRFSMGKPPACTTTAIDISAVPALCA